METNPMVENEPTIEQTKAFATGLYQSAQLVADYMKDRWPLIEGVLPKSETGYRDACMKGLWGRAHAWIQTIVKLNDHWIFKRFQLRIARYWRLLSTWFCLTKIRRTLLDGRCIGGVSQKR